MATPRITSPLGPYFSLNSISQGISILHGWHQVAQKFTSTTFPLYCAIVASEPSRAGIAKVVSGPPPTLAPLDAPAAFDPFSCETLEDFLQPAAASVTPSVTSARI